MATVLIAPGAFKNSLGANQAASAIAHGLELAGFSADHILCPIADGGNGTLDAFCATGAYERRSVTVHDPLGNHIEAEFGFDGHTAIVEMALASGLELCDQQHLQPMLASTYGTGELIVAALEQQAQHIVVGLGGSATVDGGLGCLQALGVQCFDQDDQLIPDGAGGATLAQVKRINVDGLDPRLSGCTITIACDVDNPIVGSDGSAEMFGPQKGASPEQVIELANGLDHFFGILADTGFEDVRHTPGAGAAGSIAGALMSCCNGEIAGGFELWQEHSHFEDLVKKADILITGEGRMDEQTVHGKGPMGAAQIAKRHGLVTTALVGGLTCSDQLLHDHGLDLVIPIAPYPMPLETAIEQAEQLLQQSAIRLAYALQLSEKS